MKLRCLAQALVRLPEAARVMWSASDPAIEAVIWLSLITLAAGAYLLFVGLA